MFPEVPPAVMAPPAPETIAAVALPELTEVTTLPEASSTLTTGCLARAAPLDSELDGWVVMTSWVAAPKTLTVGDECNIGVEYHRCSGIAL